MTDALRRAFPDAACTLDHEEPERLAVRGILSIGLKVAMNDNFVLSVDWAVPFNREDNPSFTNFYVKIGYMF